MPKIPVINTETGERSLVEQLIYFRQLRRQGLLVLEDEYEAMVEEEETVVVEEPKKRRGRPRKNQEEE